MKLLVVSGSHREVSQSEKVARFLAERAESLKLFDAVDVFTLAKNPLPLWDEGKWAERSHWDQDWGPVSARVAAADAVVIVSPEWAGMVPPGLKNFLVLCDRDELFHKPGLLVAVSSGTGGAYPVAELRMSGYKNSHLCWMPEHLIIRHCEKSLNPGPAPDEFEALLRERCDYALGILSLYAQALGPVRKDARLKHPKFKNGM